MTFSQVSDYIGASTLLDELPKLRWLLANRDYDSDGFRDVPNKPYIHGGRSRDTPVKYDKRRYGRRSRIEIMFGRLTG